ncbi:MAG TPA: cation:proton antiporter [Dissulfurispiraceae bacterium]|nr:cation:proton antiporter [Dissulfurispiraceae bacterium]
MHEYPVIIFAALLAFIYGLFSRLSERSPVSGPMVFVTVGLLASPLGFGWLDIKPSAKLVAILAEIALIITLFVDASMINLRRLLKERAIPLRLLLIGLPLTMLLGIALAFPMFPGMNSWALALMAFMLSPTDAALGLAVVTNKAVPEKIRQSINVESGLNDGLALPPILICIAALMESETGPGGIGYWLAFTLKQMILGPVVGGLVGWFGGLLMDKASTKGWMSDTFQRIASIALALIAYALAEEFHGNGFIAAFFGGLLLGARTHAVRERIQEFAEAEGQQKALYIFLLLGLVLVPAALPYWDIHAWIYSLLSLTVIRMLPVAVCLVGSGLDRQTVSFIGWFGPRGIASVLYLLIVIGKLGTKGLEYMYSVVALTVLLSVFLHGLSAVPLSSLYGRFAAKQDRAAE